MTETESKIRWGCTSRKILFSAAMNSQMINKTRRLDSKEYLKADNDINKQKTGTIKIGSGEKVHCQCVLEKYWLDYKLKWCDSSQCSVSFSDLHPPLSLLPRLQNQIWPRPGLNFLFFCIIPPGLAYSAYSMSCCTHMKPWPDPPLSLLTASWMPVPWLLFKSDLCLVFFLRTLYSLEWKLPNTPHELLSNNR